MAGQYAQRFDDNEGNSAGPDNNTASAADDDEVSVFNDFHDDGDMTFEIDILEEAISRSG